MIERSGTRQPLLLAGYDPQQSGELAKELPARLATFLGAPENASMPDLKELLETRRAEFEQKHGKPEVAFWQRAIENDEVWKKLQKLDGTEYFNLRDEWMGKNLIWLAEERFKDEKIVVWAATRHIAHEMKSIRRRGKSQYQDTKCMGEYVHEHFGDKSYTVGFAAHGGRGGRWFQAKWDLPPPDARSIEHTLLRYGKPLLFVDFRAKKDNPFNKPLKLSVLAYVRDYTARWAEVIDGLFYIEEMVPAAYMGD
jgi:erythromycin esterase-like protein